MKIYMKSKLSESDKMSYEKKNIKKEDLPYTMVSHTSLLTRFRIVLKAKGVKQLIQECHDEDLIHIIVHDKEKTEFMISKYIHKNKEK